MSATMPTSAERNSRSDALDEAVLSCLDHRRLELIVLPTEKCNFRCTYCYERFEQGRMAPPIVSGIKRLISDRVGDLEFLKLSWFGGEPLLAKNVVLDVSSHALAACGEAVSFAANVTTNGFLLDRDTFRALLAAGVRYYQITLDGEADSHDCVRVTANGSGTFDRIWSNLSAMGDVDLDFGVVIRLHYTAGRLRTAEKGLKRIVGRFAGDSRFSVLLKELARLGGVNDDAIVDVDPEEKKALIERARRMCRGRISLSCDPADIKGVCYASKLNSFVVRPDGRLGKCTVALDDPRNTVGRLLEDGSIAFDMDKLKAWVRGLDSLEFDHLFCPYSRMFREKPETDIRI